MTNPMKLKPCRWPDFLYSGLEPVAPDFLRKPKAPEQAVKLKPWEMM